ncbi:hypothetical protein D3C72_1977850 [compost metagenome]
MAAGDATTAAFRARCVGEYRHSAQRIDVESDAAGELLLTIASQPRRRLRPLHGRMFELEDLPRIRVEFRMPGPDTVDALVFSQPNGTFLAMRVVA